MDIRPIAGPEFSFQDAGSDVLPALPLRMLALGNSGSGKTVAIINLITDGRFYGKRPWEKVYWCSPTSAVDDALAPLRRYVVDVLKQDQLEDPTFLETIDVPFLQSRIERQRKITEKMKNMTPRPKKGFGILIVLDVFETGSLLLRLFVAQNRVVLSADELLFLSDNERNWFSIRMAS